MIPLSLPSMPVATLILVSSLLLISCSSSSDSMPLPADDVDGNGVDSPVIAEDEMNGLSNDSNTLDEVNGSAAQETDIVLAETIPGGMDPDATTQSTPDPFVQNRIQVDFGITVPVYQSDALQVQLIWGDVEVNAEWVGDQSWSATLDLPANTENALNITFYDNNGEIELASFDQSYRTGSNSAENFMITAEQFNSENWDSDNDGSSNLEELIAGTNPNINEDSLLEVRDSIALPELSNVTVSGAYEGRIPDDRPYNFTAEPPHPDFPGSDVTNINIDENGNGSIVSFYQLFAEQQSLSATRTSSGNFISWDVVRFRTDGDVNRNLSVTNTVTVVDGNMRTFVENVVGSNSGTNIESWETSSNLTGEIIDQTSFCKPISGIITNTYSSNFGFGLNVTTTTVQKESDQPNWRVIISTNENILDEYFARDLIISILNTSDSGVSEEQAYFKCDFVDF